jgi:hypothetical protein
VTGLEVPRELGLTTPRLEAEREIRTVFLDGNPPGCVCTARCEMPCWQRVGLTDQACCSGCAPLGAVDDER